MTITFFLNRLNHHQAPVADELYSMIGPSFSFVETQEPNKNSNKGSFEDFSSRPYLIQVWRNDESATRARMLALKSDVAVFGACSLYYQIKRARCTNKLSFDMSERWLKRGAVNLFSPRLLKHLWYYHTLFYKKPVYKLCSSAYAAKDQYALRSFQNRCFKWGYFTAVPDIDLKKILKDSQGASRLKIMWVARFLVWKHPESPVRIAAMLKKEGIDFEIDMYGIGPEWNNTKRLVDELDVADCVNLRGAAPNEEIIRQMRLHQIFLFTSDRNEGWGAVLNEAMSNGCAVVASDAIGSVPYLIDDGINGLIYKDGDINDLFMKVKWLSDNPDKLENMVQQAYETMKHVWSPANAARSLLTLSENIINNVEDQIVNGPCSRIKII